MTTMECVKRPYAILKYKKIKKPPLKKKILATNLHILYKLYINTTVIYCKLYKHT